MHKTRVSTKTARAETAPAGYFLCYIHICVSDFHAVKPKPPAPPPTKNKIK